MKSLIDKFKDLIIKYGSPKVDWDNCPKQLQKELEKNYPYTFPILYGRKYGYRGFICDQYIIRVTNITDSHHLKFDSESQVIDHIVPIMLGFRLHIDPKLIGGKENLCIIGKEENLSKNDRLTFKAIRVLQNWKYLVPKGLVNKRSTTVLSIYKKLLK